MHNVKQAAATTTYTVTGLQSGTDYGLAVAALNGSGASTPSGIVTASIEVLSPPPRAAPSEPITRPAI